MLAAFQSPEDFTVREQSLQYSNGDSYEVRQQGSSSGMYSLQPRPAA